MDSSSPFSANKLFPVLMLFFIAVAGFYIRFDSISYWLDNKSSFFTATGLPVTIGVDSYFYMDIAKDLLEKIQGKTLFA